jgi:FkbM family methyltransferase
LIDRVLKPWFVYRPMQIVRRSVAALRPPTAGYKPLTTSWGVPLRADPTRTIGRCILTTGIYDLTVSEVLARLIRPGATVVDCGANIGYMTVLAAVAAGPTGKVIAFEPNPALFPVLEQNVSGAREHRPIATVDLRQEAIGDRSGTAELVLPKDISLNDGIAHIAAADDDPGAIKVTVALRTLDETIGDGAVDVMKIDVEGFELQVLEGAIGALRARRIRHIVFEEHHVEGSAVIKRLRELGYSVLAIGWRLRGISLQPIEAGSLANKYEAASFVASIAPDEVAARCEPRGWSVLDRRFGEHPR